MLLSDSFKKSILEFDAFLKNGKYGNLVIENSQVYLYTEDDVIELNQNNKIEVFNPLDRKYYSVTYDDVLTKKCADGFLLYAGKLVIVY